MTRRLIANRKFITLKQGFRKMGQALESDHPDFAHVIKGALKAREENSPNPVWLIEDVEPVKEPAKEPVKEPAKEQETSKDEAVKEPVKKGVTRKKTKA